MKDWATTFYVFAIALGICWAAFLFIAMIHFILKYW